MAPVLFKGNRLRLFPFAEAFQAKRTYFVFSAVTKSFYDLGE
jgi:hypothetical protein